MEEYMSCLKMVSLKLGTSLSEETVMDVYEYWRKRRLHLKKPLLRMFWKKPSNTDQNPNVSF